MKKLGKKNAIEHGDSAMARLTLADEIPGKGLNTKTGGTFSSSLMRRARPGVVVLGLISLLCATDCGAGTFVATGSLTTNRYSHTATLLPDGKVLVVGGFANESPNDLATAELYDPPTGRWSSTGSPNAGRSKHTATLLPNGKVLVVGGYGFGTSASAELYDPATGNWTPTGSLNKGRLHHTATLLPNGKVLVAGGWDDNFPNHDLASAELYDPATGNWTPTGSMGTGRDSHTATLLLSGKVLVTGGNNDYAGTIASAELYDPATGQWTATGSLGQARLDHSATLLPNGKVLVAAGRYFPVWAGGYDVYLASAELYDPATGRWSPTGSLHAERLDQAACLLPDGQVMVSGGAGNSRLLESAEFYDPSTGLWSSPPGLHMVTVRVEHTATVLLNDTVLLAGGAGSSAELYYPGIGPPVSVTTTGGNVIVSWPVSVPTLYQLYKSDSVVGPWTNAGSPRVVGPQYQVIQPATGTGQFFRLQLQ